MPRRAPEPTPTSFALLGLLALRTWSAYELTQQSRRSLRFFWPRSEAALYQEPKRLVQLGYAEADRERVGRRPRTVYRITPAGRAALRRWLRTEPAGAVLEIEGLLRLLHADQGRKQDVLAALRSTADQARATRRAGVEQVRQYLDGGGPFPERLHIAALLSAFYSEFVELLIGWCDDAVTEVERWPSTRDVGLTPHGRELLTALLAKYD